MKISIITATFNSEKTLADTIQSVLDQTYTDIEYVIIDGASADRTVALARSYESRFLGRMHIVSEPDKGIYDALNKGIRLATGDVVGFVHADDLLADPRVIDRVAQAFSDPACEMVYGDLLYVGADNKKTVRYWKSAPFKKGLLRKGWMPAHPTLYVRKEVYQQYGGFDTRFSIAADYDFILRVFSQIEPENVVYLPHIMVRMRVGGASNKSIVNIIRKTKEDWRALQNNKAGGWYTLVRKNGSKVSQFFSKE